MIAYFPTTPLGGGTPGLCATPDPEPAGAPPGPRPRAAFRDRPDIFTFQGGPPALLTHSAKSTLCLNVKKSKPRKGLLLTCQIVKLFDFFDKSTYF